MALWTGNFSIHVYFIAIIMRTIKFRGKRKDNGEWMIGDLSQIIDSICMFPLNENGIQEVNPETVGQFTGLTDKNGTEIFEGDIMEWTLVFKSDWKDKPDTISKSQYTVVFEDNNIMGIVGYYFKDQKGKYVHFHNFGDMEVIGNIHTKQP